MMNPRIATELRPAHGAAVLAPERPAAGLLFDMGDVLYDATLWRRWLLRLLRHMGLHANYRGLYRVWDVDYLDAVHRGQRDYDEAFGAFLNSLGLSPAQVDEVRAASQAQKHELESGTRAFPTVAATITRLSTAGVALGVLSDSESPAAALAEKLACLGLGDRFGVVISSLDLHRTKPDPACYQAALAAMKLPADRVAFVGHDADELRGAAAVGMFTVAFNYDPEVMADRFIDRFDELLDFVPDAPRLAAAG